MNKFPKLMLLAASCSLIACSNEGREANKQSVDEFKRAYATEVAKQYSGLNIEGDFEYSYLDEDHNVVQEVKVQQFSADITTANLPTDFIHFFSSDALRNMSVYVAGSATKFSVQMGEDYKAKLDEVSVKTWINQGGLYFDYEGANKTKITVQGEKVDQEALPMKVVFPGLLNSLSFELDSSYIDEYGLAYARVTEKAGWNYLNFSAKREDMVALMVAPSIYNYTLNEAPKIPEGMRDEAIAAYRKKVSEEAGHTLEDFNLDFKIGYNSSGLGPIEAKGHGTINIGYEATGEVDPMFPQFQFKVDIQANHRVRDAMPLPNESEFTRM